MRKSIYRLSFAYIGLSLCLWLLPAQMSGADRIQIELYGGISYINPSDINLFSISEQQYNNFFFIEPRLYMQGYFVNDLPEIKSMLPGGVRLKYRMTPKLSFSLAWEGFITQREESLEGTLTYEQPTWSEYQTKAYDPYRLELKGYALLGGIHYRIPLGTATDLEAGLAAGWATARFDYNSTWSHTIHFETYDWWFTAVDGGTLEGDGRGNGFMGQVMLRISRHLGGPLGFFIETTGTFCRLKSLEGSGRETRVGIPGETTWDGTWGIKQEVVTMSWDEITISTPTNYWGGWTENQRERDFVLDLSGARVVLGIYFRF